MEETRVDSLLLVSNPAAQMGFTSVMEESRADPLVLASNPAAQIVPQHTHRLSRLYPPPRPPKHKKKQSNSALKSLAPVPPRPRVLLRSQSFRKLSPPSFKSPSYQPLGLKEEVIINISVDRFISDGSVPTEKASVPLTFTKFLYILLFILAVAMLVCLLAKSPRYRSPIPPEFSQIRFI